MKGILLLIMMASIVSHEWPSCPIPEHEGMDEKKLLATEVLPEKGMSTWPDGFCPEQRENRARLAPKCHFQAPDACKDGVDDKWQARKLTTLLSKALEEILPTRGQ